MTNKLRANGVLEFETRSPMRSTLHVIATVSLLGHLASAQSVRGVVTDRDTRAGLPGVVVALLDSGGNAVARTLTTDQGEYRIVAPYSGPFRLRTMRIGFHPLTSEQFALSVNAEVVRLLTIASVPVQLDTIRVVRQKTCGALGDSTRATYALWEQIRTALTAAQLTAKQTTISASIVDYEREIDPGSHRVTNQHAAVQSGFVSQPWQSPNAESLRQTGYVVSQGSGEDTWTTYYAPGLDVLLSDEFVEAHCFRLAASDDERRVGIAFQPVANRRVPEIAGTLWLDRQSSELRSLEFRYVNLTREQEGSSGGDMDFVAMKNGTWAISRWSIRMPVIEQVYTKAGARSRAQVRETVVSSIKAVGAELVRVTRGNDTLWTHAPSVLSGLVTDSSSGAVVGQARVSVVGTQLASVSDANGHFSIVGILPGEYTLRLQTPALDSMEAVHELTTMFTDSASTIQIRVPSTRQLWATICAKTIASASGDASTGVIVGTANTRGHRLIGRRVQVIAEWDDTTSSTSAARSGTVRARSDGFGEFRICGLPLDITISVRPTEDAFVAKPIAVRIPASRRVARIEMALDEVTNNGALLTGTVLTDSTRQPLANVEIAFPELSKRVVTDERGSFRISAIPAGKHRLIARRVGYGSLETQISFDSGATVQRQIFLTRLPVLDPVDVTASALLPDFEEHRRLGLGSFITRAELEKQEARRLSDVLSQIRGVKVMPGIANHAWIASSRGIRSIGTGAGVSRADGLLGAKPACYVQVYIDNTPVYKAMKLEREAEPLFDVNVLSPAEIEAIEFYAGPAQTPAKYSNLNSECGVLVIHSRRSR